MDPINFMFLGAISLCTLLLLIETAKPVKRSKTKKRRVKRTDWSKVYKPLQWLSPFWLLAYYRPAAIPWLLMLCGLIAIFWYIIARLIQLDSEGGAPKYATAGPGGGPPPDALHEVYVLTHDEEVAERLLMACWRDNPDRDWRWVVDRVIRDIIRDRR